MHTSIVGLFRNYEQAEAAIEDLEQAGIVGENVEMISDPDRDARAAEQGMKPKENLGDRIARLLGRSAKHDAEKVYAASGDQPDYIGEQEFYATHVRSEGAILVIRVTSPKLASVATDILTRHGSQTRDGKSGVATSEVGDRPHLPESR